jgi:hypothetical protein
MANQRIPNDPYRTGPSDDEYASRLEREAQIDPELAEGPASGGRIALYAVGIFLVLGAVFYGLNHTTTNEASTAPPPAQTAQTQPASPPQAPPGMRDVTPRAPTSQPGVTTGSAATSPPAGQNNGNR